MISTDYLIIGLLVGTAAVHIYFGVRYRTYFVVDAKSLDRSYLVMISEFAKVHPGPGGVLKATIVAQIGLVAVWAIRHLM